VNTSSILLMITQTFAYQVIATKQSLCRLYF